LLPVMLVLGLGLKVGLGTQVLVNNIVCSQSVRPPVGLVPTLPNAITKSCRKFQVGRQVFRGKCITRRVILRPRSQRSRSQCITMFRYKMPHNRRTGGCIIFKCG